MNTVPPRPKLSDFAVAALKEHFEDYEEDAIKILGTVFSTYGPTKLTDEQINTLASMRLDDPFDFMSDMNDKGYDAVSREIFEICEPICDRLEKLVKEAVDGWAVEHDVKSKALPIGTPVSHPGINEPATVKSVCDWNHGYYFLTSPSVKEGYSYYVKFEEVTEITN